jgi:hypothetical protein
MITREQVKDQNGYKRDFDVNLSRAGTWAYERPLNAAK